MPYIIDCSPYGHVCTGASIDSLASFRIQMLYRLSINLLSSRTEAQLRFSLIDYRLFGLACVGTVDNSLKSLQIYVRGNSRDRSMRRKPCMYTVASVRRQRLHKARVVGLVRLH